MRTIRHHKLPLNEVVNQRLKLQSTKNQLYRNFGIRACESYEEVKRYLKENNLSDFSKKLFFEIVGGSANLKTMEKFLN